VLALCAIASAAPDSLPPPDAPRAVSPERASTGDPPAPAVSIRVRVLAEVAPGRELTYRLIAENNTRASAHHVTVKATLPPGAARFVRASPEPTETSPSIVWKLGTLAGCSKREITLVVLPTGTEDLTCCARVQFEHGQCVRTRVGKAASASAARGPEVTSAGLQLRVEAPQEAARYDIFRYKLEIRNATSATARNVIVRAPLFKSIKFVNSSPAATGDDSLIWNIGDLEPGRSSTVEYQATGMEPGTVTLPVSVESTGLGRKDASHTLHIREPKLAVTITGPRQRGVGRSTTFHITVQNTGDWPLTNVHLVDDLLKEIAFQSATAGGRLDGEFVRWNLGTIPAGGKRNIEVVVKARRSGQFENRCTVEADRGLKEQARCEIDFRDHVGLVVEIDPEKNPIELNEVANVIVRVHNAGTTNEEELGALITLPAGLKLLGLPGTTGFRVDGLTIRLPKRRLNAGEEAAVVLRVQALKAEPQPLRVEATGKQVAPDKAVKAEEVLKVVPLATKSRKISSW
jgi:uncharacterized repeat protein (TIGR01451 family)